jgi:ABC-type nitrate/sulfonate/bicarbonate transport system substrate-binding protein
MRIEVALEWFLNPDHLPLIVGIQEGWFAEEGLEVSLKVPNDHYDGMAAATAGDVAFAVNEPLHMLDEPRPGLKACGCFFETDGGVLLHRAVAEALFAGEPIRIASPVAGGRTDDICRLILKRWAAKRGYEVDDEQIAIEEAGFEHLENMKNGFDGAWLVFDNFEGVQARRQGLNVVFVKTEDADLPNFSALELFTSERFLGDHPQAVAAMQRVLTRAVERLREDFDYAQGAWYAYSGEEKTPLSDAIVVDTCSRFVAPVRTDRERWWPLFFAFRGLGLSAADQDAYEALFAPAAAEAAA